MGMTNPLAKQDDVITATDTLMMKLLKQANDGDEVDFAVQIVQSATKWVAVKNKLTAPDHEDNFFDGIRGGSTDSDRGGGPATPSAIERGVAVRAGYAGTAAPRRRHAATSTRATRAARVTSAGIRKGLARG